MPRVRRLNVPPALFGHLLDRVQSRKIRASQLELLAKWLDGGPDVPEGPWYKRFSRMTVCGEGELIKTFLLPGQAPKGEHVGLLYSHGSEGKVRIPKRLLSRAR